MAAGAKLGALCTGDKDCQSNNCESSTKKDSDGKAQSYCSCSTAADCTAEYGETSDGGIWNCQDGAVGTYDLNYCVSSGGQDFKTALPDLAPGVSGQDLIADFQIARQGLMDEIIKNKPRPAIHIPGLTLGNAEPQVGADGVEYLTIPWIGQMIAALYKFGMATISIVAVAIIIKKGFDIILSAGGEDKVAAYKRIGEVMVALVLAWGSYAILYYINPDLVQFKALKVQYVVGIDVPDRFNEDRPDNIQMPHGKGQIDIADRTSCQVLTPGTVYKGAFTTYWNIGKNDYGKPGKYSGVHQGPPDPALQGMDDFFCAVSMECGCPNRSAGGNGYGKKVCGTKNPWPVCNYFPESAKWCEKKDYIPGGSVAASSCFPRNCKIETGGHTLIVKDRGSGIIGTHFDLYLGATGDPDFVQDTSWLDPNNIKIVDCPGTVSASEQNKLRASYNRRKPGVCVPGQNC